MGLGIPGHQGRVDHPGATAFTRSGAGSTASRRTAACSPPLRAASSRLSVTRSLSNPPPDRQPARSRLRSAPRGAAASPL